MVPKRFAPAVKVASSQDEAGVAGIITDKEYSALDSPKRGNGPELKPGNIEGAKPYPRRQAKPKLAEDRLAMVTGSIVLAVAAVIGILGRRKPPSKF